MLYESMLVFGLVFAAALIFSVTLDQRHALSMRGALLTWLFLVLGVYFAWSWARSGQTLAMKTWRIRLVDASGKPVGFLRAAIRYVLAWLWFFPGLAIAWLLGEKTWMLVIIPFANMFLWAVAVFLDPRRQFLHDRLAGTRLIALDGPGKNPAQ